MNNLNSGEELVGRDENQYLHLIQEILTEGVMEEGRNGFTKSVFGAAMHFSLSDNKIPLLTTKRVAWKTCLKEIVMVHERKY